MPETAHKRQLTSTIYATPLMTPTTALGLSICLSMFELRETGDWDIFLGPPERARAETGGADQWVLKRRECLGFARVNKVTSASLGYPLSVFNKNSILKYGFIAVATVVAKFAEQIIAEGGDAIWIIAAVVATIFVLLLLCTHHGQRMDKGGNAYSSVPGHRNWQIETAVWNLAGFLHCALETR